MKGSQVTIDHVSKRFGDFVALDDINFTIEPGEFFSLLGPSGCGKTTLLRIIAGFEFPDDGVVLFDDKNIISLPPDKRPSNTVFQTYALFPHLTVYENVAFPLRLKKGSEALSKEELDKKVREYVHLVQLDQHINKKPNQLSGGQKQRVAIVRMLCMHPEVMLFDEVTAALDPEMVREVLDVMMDLANDKKTMLIVTHQMQFARAVADKIVFMDGGEIVEISTPEEFWTNPKTERAKKFLSNFEFESRKK